MTSKFEEVYNACLNEQNEEGYSPAYEQYKKIRSQMKIDAILLIKFADSNYYHVFGSDAEVVSKILGTVLNEHEGIPVTSVSSDNLESKMNELNKGGKPVAMVNASSEYS